MCTKTINGRIAGLQLLLLVLCGAIGCEPQTDSETTTPPPTVEELAKQRFENFVTDFRRRIKETETGRAPAVIGGPMVRWKTSLTEQLLPPEAEGLAWRAKVTVTTKSNVTYITAPSEEPEEPKRKRRESENVDDDQLLSTGDADIDAALKEMSTSGGAAPPRGPLMQVIDDDKTDVYDLIFEDGRWRLTTPIDEETQIGLSLKIALKSQ